MENYSLKMIILPLVALCLMSESGRLAVGGVSDEEVKGVCKKTSDFDLCMTILFPDKRRYDCGTKGLAKIMMEKDSSIAQEILGEVQGWSHDSRKRVEVREKCGECAKEYNGIVSEFLPNADKYLDLGRYEASIEQLNYVLRDTKTCDDQFLKANMTIPFVNMSVHDIALIAITIIKTLE